MNKLDNLDRKIMYELDLNARASSNQIAKKLRTSKETINFRIKRLIKDKYLKGFYTIFDTAKLGRFYFKTLIKFNGTTPEIEEKIISFLSNQEKCAYLGSCDGPYDLTLLIAVEETRQFKEFMIQFKNKFGDYILENEVHVVLSTHRFNQKFLHSGTTSKHSYYQDRIEKPNIDRLDVKIMKCLSENARISLVEISKIVKADAKVVNYRIKNLQKKGIILAFVSAPNFDKLGFEFIQLNFKLKRLDSIKEIIEFFDKTNRCMYALELLGKYDLTIELHVENDKVLRDIIESFKKNFVKDISDYDIFNVYKEHKVIWLPL